MRKESSLNQILDKQEGIELSYSKISKFDRTGVKSLITPSSVHNMGIQRGSLIDDILFSPKIIKDKYYYSSCNKPTSTLGLLCDKIIKSYEELPELKDVINIVKESGYWKNIVKEDVLLSKFNIDDFWNYLKDIYNNRDKILITLEDKIIAEDTILVLKTHEYSKHLFDDNLEHIYQYEFKFDYYNIKFKGIIDIISIDHKNKKIYLKDLKTGTANSSKFYSSFIKYRYYLQAIIYKLAYKQIVKELGIEEYELQPFEFVYISLYEKIPTNFIMTDKWNKAALHGFYYNGEFHRGLLELVDEIVFHIENNIYDVSKIQYENRGRINIDDNLIKLR